MQRLIEEKPSTAQNYSKIYEARRGTVAWDDARRWEWLMKKYKGGTVIDIGCLDSRINRIVGEKNYLGIDVSDYVIKKMQRFGGGGKYLVASAYEIPYPKETFDYAVMGELIEHLEDPEAAVLEAFRVLKRGGTLALSTPLEEIREPGAVDKENHIWSFEKQDMYKMMWPFADKIKIKILRSQWFPKYRYCWPTIVCWAVKH